MTDTLPAPVTMPHMTNCDHHGDGWCLDCVRKLYARGEEWRVEAARLRRCAAELAAKGAGAVVMVTIGSADGDDGLSLIVTAPTLPNDVEFAAEVGRVVREVFQAGGESLFESFSEPREFPAPEGRP